MRITIFIALLAFAVYGVSTVTAAVSKAFLLYSMESTCVRMYVQSGYERSAISTGNGQCNINRGNARSGGSTDGVNQ